MPAAPIDPSLRCGPGRRSRINDQQLRFESKDRFFNLFQVLGDLERLVDDGDLLEIAARSLKPGNYCLANAVFGCKEQYTATAPIRTIRHLPPRRDLAAEVEGHAGFVGGRIAVEQGSVRPAGCGLAIAT